MGNHGRTLTLLLLVLLPACSRGDAFEVHPLQPEVVIRAPWGTAPGEFTPYPEWVGHGEVGHFGGFALAADGTILIADERAGEVELFGADGRHLRTVVVTERPAFTFHVDQLALVGEAVYWFQDTPWGIRLRRTGLGKGSGTTEVPVCPPFAFRGTAAGQGVSGLFAFHRLGNDLYLWSREGTLCVPLVRGQCLLAADRQAAATSRGLPLADGRRVLLVGARGEYRLPDGREAGPGDVLLADTKGRPLRIIARGRDFYDLAGERLLLLTGETVAGTHRTYAEVRDVDGRLLSRTRTVTIDWDRAIMVRRRFRLAPDGTFDELVLGDDGVRVVHWH